MQYIIPDTIPYKPGALSKYQIILKFRNEYPATAISQSILLHEHPEEFFETVEKKVIPKALKDIMSILRKGYANRISTDEFGPVVKRYDFSHFHLLSEPDTIISGKDLEHDLYKIILSSSGLYHTREFRGQAHMPEHNILSSPLLTSEPRPIDPREYKKANGCAVNHLDLDKIHLAQFNLKADENGKYILDNGTKLDIIGILNVDIPRIEKTCFK